MDHPEQLIRSRNNRQAITEMFVRGLLGGTTYLVVGAALLLFGGIVKKGAPVIFKTQAPFVDFAFLTSKTETLHVFDDPTGKRREMPASEFHRYLAANGEAAIANEQTFSYSGGGIAGPIVGTALLTVTSMMFALLIGVSAAIFLSEYSKHGKFISIVRLAILNLSGVPSIVFGLFGYSVFVLAVPVITDHPSKRSLFDIPLLGSNLHLTFQGWNSSLIAGAATLACMILPVVITASEASLRSVPQGLREASIAMGATQWQTIRKCVLPFALPGILTSSILAVTRVAGETAPIMFTAAVAAKDDMPWQGLTNPFGILTTQVQALPYHIYTLAARVPNSEYTEQAKYGSVFVFLLMVAALSATSVILRNHVRSKHKW